MQRLSIGKLAKAANVSIDTIRFYEKSGLLPRPARRPSGYREYSDLDVLQLQFVRRARAIGVSLDEIAELLNLGDEMSAEQVRDAIGRKLAIVNLKLTQLEQWRRSLNALARRSGEPLTRRAFLLNFSADELRR
jgi:MerR family transcriptional regulator, copper efflux regulator